MSAALTSQSKQYASKARDLHRQVRPLFQSPLLAVSPCQLLLSRWFSNILVSCAPERIQTSNPRMLLLLLLTSGPQSYGGLCTCTSFALLCCQLHSSCSALPTETHLMSAQALIRKYMPIGVIALIFLFVLWARWFFYGRR